MGKPAEVRPAELSVRAQRAGFSRMSHTCRREERMGCEGVGGREEEYEEMMVWW